MQPSSPSKFEPCIRRIMEFIEERKEMNEYNVLLIITNEPSTDWATTIPTIAEASHLPLSIILVELGDTDILKYDSLQTDSSSFKDFKRKPSLREIFQFAKYSDYDDFPHSLKENLLQQIPDQFIEYRLLSS